MKIVLYNVDDYTFEIREIEDKNATALIDLMHEYIDCVFVDRACVSRDGLTAWVDDNGLANAYLRPSAVCSYPGPLVGNIVFTGPADEEGKSLGVPERFLKDDCKLLKRQVIRVSRSLVGLEVVKLHARDIQKEDREAWT